MDKTYVVFKLQIVTTEFILGWNINTILRFTINNPINIAIIIVIDDINCKAASIAVDVPSILLFKADIIIELFLLIWKEYGLCNVFL